MEVKKQKMLKINMRLLSEVIQKNNNYYMIEKTEDESRDVFLSRVDYIIKRSEKSPHIDIEDIINLSYIWKNVTFNGMTYSLSITKKL